jgi:hypothetical protein
VPNAVIPGFVPPHEQESIRWISVSAENFLRKRSPQILNKLPSKNNSHKLADYCGHWSLILRDY